MYAKLVAVLALVGLTVASPTTDAPPPPFAGVDPNTLSCDPEGQVFLLLPHFTDCNKFFMCDHGKEKLFSCPSDLIFDFELQTCNWKWATECILRDSTDEGSGDEIEGSGDDAAGFFSEESESFDVVQDDENEESEVPSEFQSILNCHKSANASKRISYKGDCQRYWHCVSGTLKADYCSDGLFFNPQTQQCDFEANVKCDQQIVNELGGEYIEYKK
ncbi:hypothetical protein ACJJTC_010987 [Scirpophaga incertulas]